MSLKLSFLGAFEALGKRRQTRKDTSYAQLLQCVHRLIEETQRPSVRIQYADPDEPSDRLVIDSEDTWNSACASVDDSKVLVVEVVSSADPVPVKVAASSSNCAVASTAFKVAGVDAPMPTDAPIPAMTTQLNQLSVGNREPAFNVGDEVVARWCSPGTLRMKQTWYRAIVKCYYPQTHTYYLYYPVDKTHSTVPAEGVRAIPPALQLALMQQVDWVQSGLSLLPSSESSIGAYVVKRDEIEQTYDVVVTHTRVFRGLPAAQCFAAQVPTVLPTISVGDRLLLKDKARTVAVVGVHANGVCYAVEPGSLRRRQLCDSTVSSTLMWITKEDVKAYSLPKLVTKVSESAVEPSAEFRAALSEIFERFGITPAVALEHDSESLRVMYLEQFADFFWACETTGDLNEAVSRMFYPFVMHSETIDKPYLRVEDFIRFYSDEASPHGINVWPDLFAHGYNARLQRKKRALKPTDRVRARLAAAPAIVAGVVMSVDETAGTAVIKHSASEKDVTVPVSRIWCARYGTCQQCWIAPSDTPLCCCCDSINYLACGARY